MMRLATLGFVAGLLGLWTVPVGAQLVSSPYELTARDSWQQYREQGKFKVAGANKELAYLWHNHVQWEIKNPRFKTLRADWTQHLFYSWALDDPFRGREAILETVQKLPAEVLAVVTAAEGVEKPTEMLSCTPELITATVEMLGERSDASNPFIETFAEKLVEQVAKPGGALGAASLAELHTLWESGLLDSFRIDVEAMVESCGSEEFKDAEVRKAANGILETKTTFARISDAFETSRTERLGLWFGDHKWKKKDFRKEVRDAAKDGAREGGKKVK
jgi:hypothetical protein